MFVSINFDKITTHYLGYNEEMFILIKATQIIDLTRFYEYVLVVSNFFLHVKSIVAPQAPNYQRQ